MVGFVHLHLHSAYSLLEGALPIARLAELAKADHQPALALTDSDNMFGALEFSDKMAGSGIQPIIGCSLSIDFGDQDSQMRPGGGTSAARSLPRLVLLAATEPGYRNLLRLNSRAFLGHDGKAGCQRQPQRQEAQLPEIKGRKAVGNWNHGRAG